MPKHHTAHVVLEEGLRFTGAADSGYAITMDDSADAGGGVTPVELVLIGLAGCSGMDVATILRKQRQPLRGLEVRARGTRRDELPRIFTDIALEFVVRGDGVEPAAVARALELTATRYCSVWGMLVPNAAITWSYQIIE
jgi:putative redox protein